MLGSAFRPFLAHRSFRTHLIFVLCFFTHICVPRPLAIHRSIPAHVCPVRVHPNPSVSPPSASNLPATSSQTHGCVFGNPPVRSFLSFLDLEPTRSLVRHVPVRSMLAPPCDVLRNAIESGFVRFCLESIGDRSGFEPEREVLSKRRDSVHQVGCCWRSLRWRGYRSFTCFGAK